MIGASSADIRLRGTLNADEAATVGYTYEHPAPTGITAITHNQHCGDTVYNTSDIAVGTSENFSQLPQGVFIKHGDKILKKIR